MEPMRVRWILWSVALQAYFLGTAFTLPSAQGTVGSNNVRLEASHTEFATEHQKSRTETQVKEYAPCVLCKFVVEELANIVEKWAVNPVIDREVYQDCVKYINISNICTGLRDDVRKFLDDLIDSLTPELCVAASFCPSHTGVNKKDAIEMDLSPWSPPQIKNDSLLCKVCKSAVKALDSAVFFCLNELNQYVSNICHRLTPPTDEECVKNVLLPVEHYIENIKDKLAPAIVCVKYIHACTEN